MKLIVSLAAAVFFVCPLVAQDEVEVFRAPDRGTEVRVHGVQILPVAGKPFSGRDHIQWTRKLEDGTEVRLELYAFLARDSRGRIYREHVSFVPTNSNQPSKRREIDFLDPVTHTRTVCMMAKQPFSTCELAVNESRECVVFRRSWMLLASCTRHQQHHKHENRSGPTVYQRHGASRIVRARVIDEIAL